MAFECAFLYSLLMEYQVAYSTSKSEDICETYGHVGWSSQLQRFWVEVRVKARGLDGMLGFE